MLTVEKCLADYERTLAGRGLKAKTVTSRLRILRHFGKIQRERDKSDVREMTEPDFIHFANCLEAEGLKSGSRRQYLSAVNQFFLWLLRNGLVLGFSPDQIPGVQVTVKEKTIFTREEMGLFLDTIGYHLRDRALYELLYSSALRCGEVLKLKWKDLSMEERKLRVEQGKGGRDRYVPYSRTAAIFLNLWKGESRPEAEDYLFPGGYGKERQLSESSLRTSFKSYLKQAEIHKQGLTIHSIRHSCATHLLEAGADIRYVSELLAHRSMETTVIYTHPTPESQKKAYRMYHPRENGYYREMDGDYEKELEALRRKFEDREEFIRKYVNKELNKSL